MIREASLELLDALFWFASLATRPTLATYFNVPHDDRRLYRLAESGHLQRARHRDGEWVFQLTVKGLEAAGGKVHPPDHWDRPWDGHWRILLFDMPSPPARARHRFWTWLRKNRFGCLQRSVWLTPDRVRGSAMAGLAEAPAELVVFEGRPLNRRDASDREIAASAWNFTEINRLYEAYLSVLDDYPGLRPAERRKTAFREWKKREAEAWREVLRWDPFLPRRLLPPGYLGQAAWKRRIALREKIASSPRT